MCLFALDSRVTHSTALNFNVVSLFSRVMYVRVRYPLTVLFPSPIQSQPMGYAHPVYYNIRLRPDISSGDLASCCRGRLSRGNLQGHTPVVWRYGFKSWYLWNSLLLCLSLCASCQPPASVCAHPSNAPPIHFVLCFSYKFRLFWLRHIRFSKRMLRLLNRT